MTSLNGLTCTAHSAGTLTATISETDIAGSRAAATSSATIYGDPVATLKASRTTIDAGHVDTFSVTASGGELDATGSGGLSNYNLAWTGLPSSCTSGAPLVVECSWASAGSYPISVRAIDANNFLSAPASLTVAVAPALSVSLTSSPSNALAGQTVLITALVSGGVGPFQFAWKGLPNGCTAITGSNLTCEVQGSGTFEVTVTVTDGGSGNSTASGPLTVSASFLGLPATEGYAALGGAIVAIALGLAAVVLLTRRRRRAPPQTDASPDAETPSE